MKKSDVVQILRKHNSDVQVFGVRRIGFFGSFARDEAGPKSDVDVLVEFSGPATFDNYMGLKFFLEEKFGVPVDLVMQKALKPRLKSIVEREVIYVP